MAYLTDQMAYGGIGDGRKTVTTAGIAVQISATSTPCKKVVVSALPSNTGIVTIGGSGILAAAGTETGKILYPGDSEEFMIDNLDKLYVNSVLDGEGVTYYYFA